MKSIAAAVILVISGFTLQAAPHPLRVGVFGSNIGQSANSNESGWSGGTGISASYDWSSRWSTEFSVAQEKHLILLTRFVGSTINGLPAYLPTTSFEKYTTRPIDLVARYSVVNATRFTPFIGAGLHHVAAPDTHPSGIQIPVVPNGSNQSQPVHESRFPDANNGEVVAGVAFAITPRVRIEAGARRLLTSDREQNAFDPLTRAMAGLSVRF
jgi:outer membrane protein with beta-barrel domain